MNWARHARPLLLPADGLTWAEVRAKLDCSDSYISRRGKRFASDRLAGRFTRRNRRQPAPAQGGPCDRVEPWIAKIERDVIARGVFTSVSDLKRKLMRYIRQYKKNPRTVKWKYFDPSRRITTDSVDKGH